MEFLIQLCKNHKRTTAFNVNKMLISLKKKKLGSKIEFLTAEKKLGRMMQSNKIFGFIQFFHPSQEQRNIFFHFTENMKVEQINEFLCPKTYLFFNNSHILK